MEIIGLYVVVLTQSKLKDESFSGQSQVATHKILQQTKVCNTYCSGILCMLNLKHGVPGNVLNFRKLRVSINKLRP